MNDSGDLKGQVALVTGSSSGIGAAIAHRLVDLGANVIIHGRSDTDHLQKAFESLSAVADTPNRVSKVVADFSDSGGLSEFAINVWEKFGRLNILVNNAGGDVLTGNQSNWSFQEKLDYLLKVDVTATLLLSRLIGQKMRKENPKETASSIINIGWDQATQGMAGDSGEMFATTKGAIMSMTLSLAQSLAPHVRVNCVAPGWIQTQWGQNTSSDWDQRAKSDSLMNRWGQPADVAEAVGFLASQRASFVSGQIIRINGGFDYSKQKYTPND